MFNVTQALQSILKTAVLSPSSKCDLDCAVGHILREDIRADRSYPPFNKALMDGIAISYMAWQKGQRSFVIEKVIPAGVAPYKMRTLTSCVQIMTGAVVPSLCDCVIPIERVTIKNGIAHVEEHACILGQSIRLKAKDIKKGELVFKKGVRLNPAHIGVIASLGKRKILVAAPLNIAVVSTGDELVAVGQSIKDYQTRLSNAHALKAVLESTSLANANMFHFKDDKNILTKGIKDLIKKHDAVIISGGVSMGDFDFIPAVLKNLSVKKIFHGIDQKPGKPFWFGITKERKPIFALPGNPASTLVCAYRYIVPFLFKKAGARYPEQFVKIEYVSKHANIHTIFVPVKNNAIMPHGGSGDFISWADSDGFIEYDRKQKDNIRPYFSWRI